METDTRESIAGYLDDKADKHEGMAKRSGGLDDGHHRRVASALRVAASDVRAELDLSEGAA